MSEKLASEPLSACGLSAMSPASGCPVLFPVMLPPPMLFRFHMDTARIVAVVASTAFSALDLPAADQRRAVEAVTGDAFCMQRAAGHR